MASKYYVTLTIVGVKRSGEALNKRTIHELYNIGRSLCRWGCKNHVKVRFIVRDNMTGRTLFWLYARESETRGWLYRQSRVGIYSGTHGLDF